MPSSNKTEKLGLNAFIGSDKPKMDDFNFDNAQLDRIVGGHLENKTAHLTQEERSKYFIEHVQLYPYTGDGSLTREITLPDICKMCMIFPLNKHMTSVDASRPGVAITYTACAVQNGATTGAELSGKILKVYNDLNTSGSAVRRKLNESQVQYICMLLN